MDALLALQKLTKTYKMSLEMECWYPDSTLKASKKATTKTRIRRIDYADRHLQETPPITGGPRKTNQGCAKTGVLAGN